MNYLYRLLALALFLFHLAGIAAESKPLRVFIRAGEKTHGPGQHDHPQFLAQWQELLRSRGVLADGAMTFPTEAQLNNSDVLIIFAAEGASIQGEERKNLESFLKRGGGMVVLHDGVCGKDPQWFKTIVGGSWEHGHSKWFEGDLAMYFQDVEHPITRQVSNFDLDDEMYYDLHLMPEAKILAASYAPDKRNTRAGRVLPSVYDVVPQIWSYENALAGGEKYRAFVSIPGHNYKSFNLPQYRALLMRGIAWAGKRDVDSLLKADEEQSLRYPLGGPAAPEKAGALIKTLPDFHVNLVAAEPLINKPISLDWDAKGRLWVAETPEYPAGRQITTLGTTATWNEKSHQSAAHGETENRPARDRISILEDSNHDGVMDKKVVFFDGLELVTSFVFHKDGVIVGQAPDIYWLRDTNHDDKADEKITLYTGFGTKDTHAVISNFRWGMDGWIYMTLGYSGGTIKSGDGKKEFGGVSSGVLRFKPDGSAMEQVSSKGGNTWGVDIAPDGEIFFSQANGNHINHVVMPESALARGKIGNTTSFKTIEDHNRSFPIREYEKQAYVQIDFVGGFTAASGACIYNGGAWPEKFNNTFFVTEPTVNLVHQDFLKNEGATYTASRDPEFPDKEFVASADLWFRPIHTRVGPDGALYILDFYNQAVVHNDTRGPKHGPNNAAVRPDRDHYFGRIWRVQHKEAKRFDLPKLAGASNAELVKALSHPNGWVRDTAQRVILERVTPKGAPQMQKLLQAAILDANTSNYGKVLACWTSIQVEGELSDRFVTFLASCLKEEKSPVVRKNMAAVCGAFFPRSSLSGAPRALNFVAETLLSDADARVQLGTATALSKLNWASPDFDTVAVYLRANDPWRKSAVVGLMSGNPSAVYRHLFLSKQAAELGDLAEALSQQLASSPDSFAFILSTVAEAPSASDSLKLVALSSLAKQKKTTPLWTPELEKSFKTILQSKNSALIAASLPLIAEWDKNGALAGDLKALVTELSSKLNDENEADEKRAVFVSSLMSIRHLNAEILPSVAKILGSNSSAALQKKVIEAIGSTGDPAVASIFATAYGRLPAELQTYVFDQMIKRADWSRALVEAVKENKITLATLGPNAVHRLRTHTDPSVADQANEVIDAIRGPAAKEKDALIATLLPVVTQSGNVENGHKQFLQNCAVCHKFNGEGKEAAPDLTGMGAHGPAELIVHILDPNRVVEPNFLSYSIETKSGDSYDGAIATETRSRVVLRNASGDKSVARDEIVTMKNTGRSLMPEGFEALGAETLRDILTYLCASETKFRVLDLTSAYTADSTRGIYSSIESTAETLAFKKFGLIKISDVPFEIANPQKVSTGRNLIVLRGGNGFAKTLPQHVEIPNLKLRASKLHFLGGVGGWAWPWGGEENRNLPAAKIVVHYADQQTEEFVLKNGVEVADYNGRAEVPGSQLADGLVDRGQVRYLTHPLKHDAMIDRISLESYDNAVAPTFISITAELTH